MSTSHDDELEAAKERLKKAKEKIKKKQKSDLDEPDDLVSGILDEVELKRREKGKDSDD